MVKSDHAVLDSPLSAMPTADGKLRLLDSKLLFERGANEILIRHQGELYRLRLTRNGKLILTK